MRLDGSSRATSRNGFDTPRSVDTTAVKSRTQFVIAVITVILMNGAAQGETKGVKSPRSNGQILREQLREIESPRLGIAPMIVHDADEAAARELEASQLDEIVGTDSWRPKPGDYDSNGERVVEDGDLEDRVYDRTEEEIIDLEAAEFKAYVGKPRIEKEPRVTVNGRPLAAYLDDLYGLHEMGGEIHFWYTPEEVHDREDRLCYQDGYRVWDYNWAEYLGDERLVSGDDEAQPHFTGAHYDLGYAVANRLCIKRDSRLHMHRVKIQTPFGVVTRRTKQAWTTPIFKGKTHVARCVTRREGKQEKISRLFRLAEPDQFFALFDIQEEQERADERLARSFRASAEEALAAFGDEDCPLCELNLSHDSRGQEELFRIAAAGFFGTVVLADDPNIWCNPAGDEWDEWLHREGLDDELVMEEYHNEKAAVGSAA